MNSSDKAFAPAIPRGFHNPASLRPTWFHVGGMGMKVTTLNKNDGVMIISAGPARLTIRPAKLVESRTKGWSVDWQIATVAPFSEKTIVRRHFEKEALAAAFGLSKGASFDLFGVHYVANSFEQGKYFRQGNFLNIPCHGTGMDGDSNMSVYVTDEIRNAVKELLNLYPD